LAADDLAPDQLLYSALHGTAMRYAAERRNLGESIEELREIADGRNDIVAEVAGIEAGGVAAGRRGYHRWLLPRAPGVMLGLAIGGSREEAQWRIGKALSFIGSRPRVQGGYAKTAFGSTRMTLKFRRPGLLSRENPKIPTMTPRRIRRIGAT
jgi:hypothetical protein